MQVVYWRSGRSAAGGRGSGAKFDLKSDFVLALAVIMNSPRQ